MYRISTLCALRSLGYSCIFVNTGKTRVLQTSRTNYWCWLATISLTSGFRIFIVSMPERPIYLVQTQKYTAHYFFIQMDLFFIPEGKKKLPKILSESFVWKMVSFYAFAFRKGILFLKVFHGLLRSSFTLSNVRCAQFPIIKKTLIKKSVTFPFKLMRYWRIKNELGTR